MSFDFFTLTFGDFALLHINGFFGDKSHLMENLGGGSEVELNSAYHSMILENHLCVGFSVFGCNNEVKVFLDESLFLVFLLWNCSYWQVLGGDGIDAVGFDLMALYTFNVFEDPNKVILCKLNIKRGVVTDGNHGLSLTVRVDPVGPSHKVGIILSGHMK